MGTKMKGLLKGLRYISQIFDPNEKVEREMEIGYPADVKHVAHIGWDGASVNNPSWMSEFRSVPELSSAPTGAVMDAVPAPKSASQDLQRLMESEKSADGCPVVPKQARRNRSSAEVPTQSDSSEFLKPSRRRPSIGESSDLMGQDQLSKPLKPSRRRGTHGSGALDSPTGDSNGVPRQSRRRQSKGSSGSVGDPHLRPQGLGPLRRQKKRTFPKHQKSMNLQADKKIIIQIFSRSHGPLIKRCLLS